MSVIYSHISDKFVDTDYHEVVELNNGDVVAMDDDYGLLDAYGRGLLTRKEMLDLCFEEDQL